MKELLIGLLEGVIAFFIVYVYYRLAVLKKDKFTKKNLPAELTIFLNMNNVDLKKVNYKKIMKDVSLFISLSFALSIIVTFFIKVLLLRVFVAFIVLFVLYWLSNKVLGFIYKKKGYVLDV